MAGIKGLNKNVNTTIKEKGICASNSEATFAGRVEEQSVQQHNKTENIGFWSLAAIFVSDIASDRHSRSAPKCFSLHRTIRKKLQCLILISCLDSDWFSFVKPKSANNSFYYHSSPLHVYVGVSFYMNLGSLLKMF